MKIKAFTLAEVLITLAIIGVVAALTIPSVIINYQKNMYVIQLKKEYNYFTNAFRVAMARDGVMQLSDTKLWSAIPSGVTLDPSNLQSNSEAYSEFSKIFNVVQVYDGNTNKLPFENDRIDYKTLKGTDGYGPGNNTMRRAVCLADGACFDFEFTKNLRTAQCGNHACSSLKEFQEYNNTPTKLWQTFDNMYSIRIDVNGINKGPNQGGRDFFWFELGNDGNLYPTLGIDHATWRSSSASNAYASVLTNTNSFYWKYNNNQSCSPSSSLSYGNEWGCTARIIEEGWKMNY